MADEYDRERDRDERRARRRMRRRYEEYGSPPPDRPTSALGVVALVIGSVALVGSVIPCFGVIAIPAAVIALVLGGLSVVTARAQGHGTGAPITATAVSGLALMFSLLWLAAFGAIFRSNEEHASRRPAPMPVGAPHGPVAPALPPGRVHPQPKKAPDPKIDETAFEKKVFEDLAKDRIKEAIRNGPGISVTATDLEDAFTTNAVSAEVKYRGKVLAVTGKVIRVVRDESKKLYTLELATGDPTKTVSCDFTEATKYPLASVARGQEVTVRGLCVGRENEFVKLTDCVVAN